MVGVKRTLNDRDTATRSKLNKLERPVVVLVVLHERHRGCLRVALHILCV